MTKVEEFAERLFKAWKSDQYKNQITEERMEFVEHLHEFPEYFKEAFLAGYKEGQYRIEALEESCDIANYEVIRLRKEIGRLQLMFAEEVSKHKQLKDKTEWHKVADELPEEEDYYLVFDKGTRNIIIGMYVDGKFESCFPAAWCEIPKFEKECFEKIGVDK